MATKRKKEHSKQRNAAWAAATRRNGGYMRDRRMRRSKDREQRELREERYP